MGLDDSIAIKALGPRDSGTLRNVAPDVFDLELQPDLVREFLADSRHHIVVAIDNGLVVGMATGVHYVHPDKPAQLFINEVGVAPTHQRRGIGKRLLKALLERGAEVGCEEAWVSTEPDNDAARKLYASVSGEQEPEPFVLYSFALNGRNDR